MLVDPSTGAFIDDLAAFGAVLSDDSRFIAFAKAIGNGAVVDQTCLIYDVSQSSTSNRTMNAVIPEFDAGIPVYPDDARTLGRYTNDEPARHRQSKLTWLSPRLLTFIDYAGQTVSLVLVDVTNGASAPNVRRAVVNAVSVVDASRLPDWLTPAQAIEPDSIEMVSSTEVAAVLRMHFAQKRWIRSPVLDVNIATR